MSGGPYREAASDSRSAWQKQRKHTLTAAGAATFSICLLLWVLSWVSSYNEAGWAQAVAYCSILTHFEPFSKGVIDTKDVVFYCSAIFLGLFMTARSLESLRWRA